MKEEKKITRCPGDDLPMFGGRVRGCGRVILVSLQSIACLGSALDVYVGFGYR